MVKASGRHNARMTPAPTDYTRDATPLKEPMQRQGHLPGARFLQRCFEAAAEKAEQGAAKSSMPVRSAGPSLCLTTLLKTQISQSSPPTPRSRYWLCDTPAYAKTQAGRTTSWSLIA